MITEEQKRYNKLYYEKNKERIKAQQKIRNLAVDREKESIRAKEYYALNKEKIIARTRQNSIKWFSKNYARKMWYTAQARARYSNLEFDIHHTDIHIPEYCPYLGIKITTTQNEGRQISNASLDRIDSTKGYIKGNIQVISDLANRMKQDATQEQLISFAKGILKLYGT